MKKITKGSLRRRLALGIAGARSGAGFLSAQASSLLMAKGQQQAHKDRALEREATRFVKQLGELKGAYVKIGQMLALYGEHLLPRPITKALHTLEAQTAPIDWSVLAPALKQTIDTDKLALLSISQEAFAAASLSQVHKAVLTSHPDHDLCLKIQYPGIADAIDDDFRNVMQMLTLARWVESGRQLESFTIDLKAKLLLEVDYEHELKQAQRMSALLANDHRYRVPNYHLKYCNGTVLTMDFVDGFEVTHARVQGLSQERRNRLATAMLELFFEEAFTWGLMQTDPNFGNYRIMIDPVGEDDQLVLLDFGAVHDLKKGFTDALKKTILAAHANNIEATIDGLIDLKCLRSRDSLAVKTSFAEFCCFILEPFSSDLAMLQEALKDTLPEQAVSQGCYNWRASKLLKRAGKRGSEMMFVKGFSLPPPEFMLLVRKLTGVFTFVSTIGAKTNSAELLERYQP